MKKKYLAKLEITDSPRRHEANFTLAEIKEILEKLIDYPTVIDIKICNIIEEVERKRKP